MEDIIKAEMSWSCLVCRKSGRKGARVVSEGGFYRHPACAMAPVPAADQPGQPAAAEISHWQQQAREAAARHLAAEETDLVGASLASEEYNASVGDMTEKGPWHGALYAGRCADCGSRFEEGDRVRDNDPHGYLCEDCGSFDDTMGQHVRKSLSLLGSQRC